MDFSREDLPQNLGKIRKQVRGRQKVGRKRPRAGDVSVVLPDCAKQKKAKSLLAGQKLEQLGAAALTTIEHEQFNYEKFPDKDDELGQLSDLFQELAIDKTIFTQLGRENGISFEKTTISSLKSNLQRDIRYSLEVWIRADDEKLFHNLNMTERNILKSNRWFNDIIIDSAMNLLHYQFPDLEGFQSCKLAYQLDFYKHQSTFIQIINRSKSDGGSHWLTASNINCLENTIKVYDSAYDDLPHEEELLVASLVKTEATLLQVQFSNVAIQPNGYDCGVYAIANATALAHGIDPATQHTGNILDGKQNLGGTSPHAGGRDERSVSSPATAQRWIPPSSVKRDVLTHDEKHDTVFRKVRAILNKLSPEKFDKLSLELLNVGIESQVILKGIILLIFEKALDEPKYSSVYAKLCHQLCEDAPNFEPPDSNISTFRRLLLNKCQDEFENRSKASNAFDKDGQLSEEELEQYHIAKRKMLGNIKFIGELGKLEMLHEGILHRCIKQLLEKKKNLPIQESAEDLECLCQIMTTVGRRLDTPKAKAWMDQYFSRIKQFSGIQELPSRIRFMLQDVIELRENKWKSRHSGWEGPKTITQIRQEAADETGVYIPQQNRMGGPRPPAQMNGSLGAPWKPGVPPAGPTGSFGDFFGMPPTGIMGGLGTGPGVIQMDGYIPNYNNKPRNNQHNPGYNNYQKRPPATDGGGGGSPRAQRHNFQNQQQQGGRLSPQQHGQQQQGSPVGQQQFQQKKPSNLPPRLAKLQQQQLQQQQQAPPPPSQQQAMMMMQDGQMPIPLPNTAVPPPPLPKQEEISLRPNRNFTTALRPSVPTMLPKSAQAAPSSGSPLMTGNPSMMDQRVNNLNPLLAKQAAVTIKEVPKEKLNPPKKKSHQPNKDEIQKTVKSTLNEYLEGGSLQEALTTIKELNPPKKYMPEMLTDMMTSTVDKSDTDRENVMKLVMALKSENLITSSHFMDGYKSVLEQMSDMESDVPLIKTYVARFAAFAVTESIVTLQELAEPMEQGTYYPLFLLCLQQMLKRKDKDWVVNVFNESKMDLQNMLPEVDRSKERMMEILEERGLSFMFPLLRVQSELWKQIQAEPLATAVYRWIKESVSTDLHHTPAFINVLTTSVLRYVTAESTLGEGCDPKSNPSKVLQEKEKQLLDKMKDVVQKFVQENTSLQMHCLYAAQVFCFNNNFPKGMMLRLFMDLYDMEVVDEEVFLKWKEEVNDEYPGKGKALFQVNTWLTWLEQAEVESDEED